jgi:hypothetical protein
MTKGRAVIKLVARVAGPEEIMADIGLVGLTNVVCQVGIAQQPSPPR